MIILFNSMIGSYQHSVKMALAEYETHFILTPYLSVYVWQSVHVRLVSHVWLYVSACLSRLLKYWRRFLSNCSTFHYHRGITYCILTHFVNYCILT